MSDILALASQTVLSPMVLFFVLGFAAALYRSDLSIPEAMAKAMSLYLLFAIGFKGGVAVSANGVTGALFAALLAGIVLSALIPVIAFAILRVATRLSRVDAAAVAGHYGSISIVTFVTATSLLARGGLPYEGFLVAVAAVMEAPAIFVALMLARRGVAGTAAAREASDGRLWREVALNGSIVLLAGAFVVGWITGTDGLAQVSGFIVTPFNGILCLFLLDMGLVAGRGIRQSLSALSPAVIGFGLAMPLVGAALGLAAAFLVGLSPGGAALFATLAASASYIAVPAAMRVALPEARPAIYLTLSLGVTFPFNLLVGIPLYIWAAARLTG